MIIKIKTLSLLFTMAYTISSILDLLVYAVVITVYYYFLFEI